jgi:LysM repeat protein
VRKWTKSACVVVALGILFLLAVIGFGESAHPAQAKTSIASSSSSSSASGSSSRTSGSSTQAVPARPGSLMTVTAAPLAAPPPVTWVVRPGDTLSGIAVALGVRGGWRALYAANRRVVGPDPGLIRPGMALTVPGARQPASYTVAPGDTLSGIAVALGVRGGWPALYAANRRLIGPDPGLIRPGTILAVPGRAASVKAPPGTVPGASRRPPAGGGTGPADGRTPAAPGSERGTAGGRPVPSGPPAVSGSASPAGMVPVRGTGADGIMPNWLKATLFAVGALTVAAFIAQPAVGAWQRRRQSIRGRAAALRRGRGPRAAEKAARIVEASHERLIITYSISDDTVYVLTPPGEDPRAVLRAARLVLPEDTYEELADHLGVPSGWQRE